MASASTARRRLLQGAGVSFDIDPAHLDEDAIKVSQRTSGGTATDAALALAEAKALAISARHNGAVVLGADQMLACDGVWYDKPINRDAAKDQLRALRGHTHQLISAVVAVRDSTVLWRHSDTAQLTMLDFDDRFLDDYIAACGDDVLGSVGVYHLEGRGAQLFSRVDGDYFTILGLPLLAVLAFLRTENLL